MSILDKFKLGLNKSSKSFSSGLNNLIFKRKIDESMLNELEDFLIESDVGVESAKELREKFANTKVNPKTSGKDEIYKIFSSYISEILKPLEKNLENIKENKPSVILIAGVNGVGKTTTIGKLGKILGQNKKNLMDEFKKITTVVKKIDSTSPHETFLILDATTGQSAINQVEEFKKITPITGIIMTKLDGTAKGGILLAIGRKFKLPIIALGMGEKEDDLQTFNSEYFSNALMQF